MHLPSICSCSNAVFSLHTRSFFHQLLHLAFESNVLLGEPTSNARIQPQASSSAWVSWKARSIRCKAKLSERTGSLMTSPEPSEKHMRVVVVVVVMLT